MGGSPKVPIEKQIQILISKNKTEKAFELLSSLQFSKEDKQLWLLQSQYYRVKEKLSLNLISSEEGERELNKINNAIIEFSQRIRRKESGVAELISNKQWKFNPKWLWLTIIPLTLLSWYVYQKEFMTPKFDDPAWQTAIELNTIEAYRAYILTNPKGSYIDMANNLISQLNTKDSTDIITNFGEAIVADTFYDSLSEDEYNAQLERAYFFLSSDSYEEAKSTFINLQRSKPDAIELEKGLLLIKVRKALIEGLESDIPEGYEPGKTFAKCIIPNQYEEYTLDNGQPGRRILKEGGWTEWREVICSEEKTLLNSTQIGQLQFLLNKDGYFYGPFDTIMSNNLKIAIKLFEAEHNLGSSCLSVNPTDCIMYPNNFIKRKILHKLKIKDDFFEIIQLALVNKGYQVKIDGIFDKEDSLVFEKFRLDHRMPPRYLGSNFYEKLGILNEYKEQLK